MRQLNPTLWRTCRVLAGRTRLRLLRQIHDSPGRNVSDLAEAVGIGVSDASQELRRIQSRGLLRPERRGSWLIYGMAADPQVPSAAPLLQALNHALTRFPPERDEDMIPIAVGLGHPRRILLAQTLMNSPVRQAELGLATHISGGPLCHHLQVLRAGGWVRTEKRYVEFGCPAHPLARALAKLVAVE